MSKDADQRPNPAPCSSGRMCTLQQHYILYHLLYPPKQDHRMRDRPNWIFCHTFPPSSHYTYNTHTNTHHESFDYSIYLFGYHTPCCSTTCIKFLPTSRFLSHFLRVDSQCPLTGAGIGLTPPHLCCVTQVNTFKVGHLACDLANAFRGVLVKSPTPVATETRGALR